MSEIFNIVNLYNKNISSKLTFDTAERFSGKIVKREDCIEQFELGKGNTVSSKDIGEY